MRYRPSSPGLIPTETGGRTLLAVLFGIILLSCVLNTLYRYLGAGRDDVFITLWAGKTLGTGGPWFINYNGEPQEISSSILGALFAKFAYLCCAENYYLANKLFGGGAALATLAVIWLQRRTFFRHFPEPSAIVTVALLGFNSSFAYWSLGGLETPYYALLILLYAALAIGIFNSAAATTYQNYLSLTVIQILAILCRPEGFWLIGATLALMLLYWKALPERRILIIKAAIFPPLVFLIALFAARHTMTGAIFPNPVYAKVSINHMGGFQDGWNYLKQFYTIGLIGALLAGTALLSWVLVGYTALCLAFRYQKSPLLPSLLVPALTICVYDLFIVTVKGDWMEYHRFFVPTLALKILLLVMLSGKSFAMAFTYSRWLAALAATIILTLIVTNEWGYQSPQDCSTRLSVDFFKKFLHRPNDATIGLNCAHQRDNYAIRPFIDQELSKYLAEKTHLTIVTYQGGYFPYFVRQKFSPQEITFVDTTGLLNLEIAKVEGEKIPTGNKRLDDIPAILSGNAPGLSERVSRYHPNMIYMLSEKETDRAALEAIGFERIYQGPGAVVYLRTRASTNSIYN